MAANTKVRSFGKAKKDQVEQEPIVFEFYGETIEALGTFPAVRLLDIIVHEDNGKRGVSMKEYFTHSFDKENLEKFNRVAEENSADLEELYEVMGFLIEERTKNPTKE